MKRISILAVILCGAVLLSLGGCGTSDKLASITLTQANSSSSTGFFNLKGIGGTLQLKVIANYTSGRQVDETNWATYTVAAEGFLYDNATPVPAPPLSMTTSPTGMLTAVDPAICTWAAVTSGTSGSQVSYFLTGDYKITATYKGLVSQPVFVGVASAADPNNTTAGDQCGP